MKKHVLYVSYDGMTDPLGQSQVLPYLVGLSKEGYEFSLISFEKPERFAQEKERIQEICNQNGIAWYPQNYTKRPPVLSTVYDIRKLFRVAKGIHREKKIDLLHCRSYIAALVGMRFKKKHNIPWVFDMRGFWADERVEGKIWNLKNPLFRFIYNYFKRKERNYLEQADAVVSLTSAGKDELLNWNVPQLHPGKITVLPCCVDLQLFNRQNIREENRLPLKEELQLNDAFVLGYVGSIGTWYNLKAMLQTFSQLLETHPNALFLFVTKEPEITIVKEAELLGIDSSKLRITSCSHKDVPLYISLFDQSIFYIQPSFSKTASSPTKQGELMAMGVPIICNSGVGDTEKIIHYYHGGVVVDLEKIPTLSANDYSLVNFNPSETIKGANEFFGLENGIASYNLIYKTLIS